MSRLLTHRPCLGLSRVLSAPLRTTRRTLHLAPPYLLDNYIPRYHLISSIDAAKKRSLAYAHLRECNLCPRLCGVNRYEKTGVCLIGAEKVKVNTIAPHFGEGMTNNITASTLHQQDYVANASQNPVSKAIMARVRCNFVTMIQDSGILTSFQAQSFSADVT
jgi:hypothetical protein